MYIVKIGGSLITNKESYCTPNIPMMEGYAAEIARKWDLLKGNIIIILGGGSYGNGVPLHYNLNGLEDNWKSQDLLMMTVKMFELVTEFSKVLRSYGIPCYPFQSSAYITSDNYYTKNFFIDPIVKSIDLGCLPILSGDLVFDDSNRFVIYSSDNMPELFIEKYDIERVVMLTDVHGIYEDVSTQEVVSEVTVDNYENILLMAGKSKKIDVTGGMNNKLNALMRLANRNIESVICNGNHITSLSNYLFEENPNGTIIRPWRTEC